MGTKWSAISSATPTLASTLLGIVGGNSRTFTVGTLAPIIGLTGIIDVIRDYGAVGDGVANDTTALQNAVNAAFGSVASPHASTGVHLNRILYFPPGNFRITTPVLMKYVQGGIIMGAGRFVTSITCSGGGAFSTNGMSFSHISGIQLAGSAGSNLFNLDWDNSTTNYSGALQSNTFQNMHFDGGAIGCNIGASGYMGSETVFLNCFFNQNTTAGICTQNYNAVQTQVYGGNFQGCGAGIQVNSGSVPIISGVGFQNGTNYDVVIINHSNDAVQIVGCRTESSNFVYVVEQQNINITSCSQHTSTSGNFFILAVGDLCFGKIVSCYSYNGIVAPHYGAIMDIENSEFGRNDWLQPLLGSINGRVMIKNVLYNTNATPAQIVNQKQVSLDAGATMTVTNVTYA